MRGSLFGSVLNGLTLLEEFPYVAGADTLRKNLLTINMPISETKNTPVEQPFRFAVDSALLGELGEKLVSTVHVALSELVKNSYDADASYVSVGIEPQELGAPTITVEDDGAGMTLDEVKKYWMKIGTSNKKTNPVSDLYGRLKTGSKGVGRFACRRLGLKLTLTTTAFDDSVNKEFPYQKTKIVFNWQDFVEGVDVESVSCIGSTSISSVGKTGTRLEIENGLIDEWQTRGFNYLQRQLALLVSNRGAQRPGFKNDPGFNVGLMAPELSGTPIDVRESIIDGCWGTLVASVDKDGQLSCSLNAKGLGGTKKLVSQIKFPLIKGAELRIGIVPTRKDEARRPEILANYVLSDIVDIWGGVQVRFNGFRMFPYGDPRDDWLGIDADRGKRLGKPNGELFEFAASLNRVDASRTLLNMLGMRNYLGQVEVSSLIENLIPRLDRQGFVENDAFEQLRSFARFAIDWANIHRDHYIRIRESEDAERARDAIRPFLDLDVPREEVVPKAANYLRSEIKRLVQELPEREQQETEETLFRTVKAIETESLDSHRQLRHLRLVASASTLTVLFAHEVRTVLGSLGAASARLNQIAKSVPKHVKELTALSTQLDSTKQRFDNLVGMTGIVSSFRRSDELINVHLKTTIARAVGCFQLLISNYGIEIKDNEVPSDLTVGPIMEGEIYTILLNLISNSVKSVIAAGRDARLISFQARREGKQVILRVLDSGVGLDPTFFEEVFTPFISDPSGELYDKLEERANSEDASMFGSGSGLGLPIARDVARSRGGDIKFIETTEPWKTCAQVSLP
ncbi:sensor histidine kinase [Variovorax sp. EBFNA2]|uniref:sensor histidine kinase n=1 Tax=Variovorax sp. EBFNA2 TaxID=3342097 RepID=UPI0029C06F86|nr:sensor histidine kinase [Variovorax boronicumulans]WPG38512.1 sensor histidine kinase [Variovorax boronicumulans]